MKDNYPKFPKRKYFTNIPIIDYVVTCCFSQTILRLTHFKMLINYLV